MLGYGSVNNGTDIFTDDCFISWLPSNQTELCLMKESADLPEDFLLVGTGRVVLLVLQLGGGLGRRAVEEQERRGRAAPHDCKLHHPTSPTRHAAGRL